MCKMPAPTAVKPADFAKRSRVQGFGRVFGRAEISHLYVVGNSRSCSCFCSTHRQGEGCLFNQTCVYVCVSRLFLRCWKSCDQTSTCVAVYRPFHTHHTLTAVVGCGCGGFEPSSGTTCPMSIETLFMYLAEDCNPLLFRSPLKTPLSSSMLVQEGVPGRSRLRLTAEVCRTSSAEGASCMRAKCATSGESLRSLAATHGLSPGSRHANENGGEDLRY